MTTYHINKAQLIEVLAELKLSADIPARGYKTLIQLPQLAIITVTNQPDKAYPKLPYSVTVEKWQYET